MDGQTSIFAVVTPWITVLIALVALMATLAKLDAGQRTTMLNWTKSIGFHLIVLASVFFGIWNVYWFLSQDGPPSRLEVINLIGGLAGMWLWVNAWADSIIERRRQARRAELDAALGRLTEQVRSVRDRN